MGVQYIDKIINIDQSPIGRTPRSNPATYTGTFDLIRALLQRRMKPRFGAINQAASALM
ncbi:hypothetical protein M5E89_02590 [Acidaminococcus intestini]|nr:hypothetical protein M5E89_02590 [Acidaminococcus intestini]